MLFFVPREVIDGYEVLRESALFMGVCVYMMLRLGGLTYVDFPWQGRIMYLIVVAFCCTYIIHTYDLGKSRTNTRT